MKTPPIVSPEEWEAAREELLVKEKELTRARDALAAERRRMPWMAVEKDYRFEGPDGPASLLDLFEGRRQLIVYRAFYAPDVTTYPEAGGAYPERACVGCSFGRRPGRAPRPPERAGHDARVRLARPPGRDPGPEGAHGLGAHPLVHDHRRLRQGLRRRRVARHTTPSSATATGSSAPTSSTRRGDEAMGSTWSYLDITALGRQEEWEDSPEGYPQTPPYQWWNYHDAYGEDA